MNENISNLIEGLANIPETWKLTPLGKVDKDGKVNPKAPYSHGWQKRDITLGEIQTAITQGQATGYGLRLGEPSGYVMAIDFDGQSAIDMASELFGELPDTVTWTSGKEGRYQALYQVPEEYQQLVKTKQLKTQVEGDGLELRYTGHQSVLPPSLHPETKRYKWINSPSDTVVAELPEVICKYWLDLCTPKIVDKKDKKYSNTLYTRARAHTIEGLEDNTPHFGNTAIPLENCLAKTNRAILNGVGEGGRNQTGATLARDLIGTENYLNAIGQQYTDSARHLFDRYCSGCTPSLEIDEAESIWRSAEGDNPSPSCTTEGIDNILDAWNRKHTPISESEQRQCPYFESSPEGGLWRVSLKADDDGTMKRVRERMGNHLDCVAYVNNPDSNGAALYLEFKSIRGGIVKWTMDRGYIVSDTGVMLSELMKRGYHFKLSYKKVLIDYLNSLGADVSKTYTVVEQTGWVGSRYVSQHKTYGEGDLVFRDIEPSSEVATEIKGTLDNWKTNVAAKCDHNSRLIFVLGVAFAAPLLPVVGLESGGFHLMGDTSTGKTTAAKVAVSVTGEKIIPNWRSTSNGLESIAGAHNHSLLALDEIGQADEKTVGDSTYMLRNGQGKTRMTKNLTNRKAATWDLIFLSTGENSLASYMAIAGKVQKGGQEVGLPDIPAVPNGSPFGLFESIHGAENSKVFAEKLESDCKKYRGTAIDEFLTRLVIDRQDPAFDGLTAGRVFKASKKLAEGTIDHAVSRVANRFGLVQVGLELAHSYGILPFPFDRIEWAVKKMFDDWLTNRGGDGSIEIKKACDRIEHLIVTNELSDRVFDPRKNDGQIVRNLLGYKVAGLEGETLELLIPTTVFDKELCDGVNKAKLIAELQARGWLAPPGGDGRATIERRVNGKKMRFYIFQPPNFQKMKKTVETVETVETPSNTEAVYSVQVSPSVSTPKKALETVETLRPITEVSENRGVSPLSPGVSTPLETPGDTQTGYIEPFLEGVSTVSSVSTQKNENPEKRGLGLKVGDRVKLLTGSDRSGQIGIVKYFSGWFAAIEWADGSIYISNKSDKLELAEVV